MPATLVGAVDTPIRVFLCGAHTVKVSTETTATNQQVGLQPVSGKSFGEEHAE